MQAKSGEALNRQTLGMEQICRRPPYSARAVVAEATKTLLD
jgi:hypothetical protein